MLYYKHNYSRTFSKETWAGRFIVTRSGRPGINNSHQLGRTTIKKELQTTTRKQSRSDDPSLKLSPEVFVPCSTQVSQIICGPDESERSICEINNRHKEKRLQIKHKTTVSAWPDITGMTDPLKSNKSPDTECFHPSSWTVPDPGSQIPDPGSELRDGIYLLPWK